MAPPHFLTLPAEVREAIYLVLFGFHRADLQTELYDSEYGVKRMVYFDCHQRSAQVLRVCSQVASEASPIFSQNTLVVAPRHSPIPSGYGRGFFRDYESLLRQSFQMRLCHLEYHISIGDLIQKENSIIVAKGRLPSLERLRVVCSTNTWTEPYEDESPESILYELGHRGLRNMMITYLSLSKNFTYLADESIAGSRICFYLCKGPKITRKIKVQREFSATNESGGRY